MKIRELFNLSLTAAFLIVLVFFLSYLNYGFPVQGQTLNPIHKDRIEIPISNLTVGWTEAGNIRVSGILINNSTYDLEDIIVDASIFDKNNKTINNENRFVIPPSSVLESTASQEFEFFIIADDAFSYNISAFGSKVS